MGQHLHGFLVGQEVLEMVFNEDAYAFFRVSGCAEPLAQFINDAAKGMLLDQVQQLFFGLEVVIQSGQRHTGRAGEIAHGSAFIAFFTEDPGGMLEHPRKLPVKAAVHGFTVGFAPVCSSTNAHGSSGRPNFSGFQGHIRSDASKLPNVRSDLMIMPEGRWQRQSEENLTSACPELWFRLES